MPALLAATLAPLAIGAATTALRTSHATTRRIVLSCTGVAIAPSLAMLATASWAPERSWLAGLVAVTPLNAPLLLLVTVASAAILLTAPLQTQTPQTLRRFVALEAALLVAVAAQHPLVALAAWIAGAIPVTLDLKPHAPRAARVLVATTAVGCAALAIGALLGDLSDDVTVHMISASLFAVAVAARQGLLPLHSWLPALLERAPTHSAALWAATPAGAWIALCWLLPDAPDLVLSAVGLSALATASWGALLALAQHDARRAYGFLFLSESALVLSGLLNPSEASAAGAALLALSSGLALSGFGMAIFALHARRGALDLRRFHGGLNRKPLLAAAFLIMGLATVGFPGTLGFVAAELLVGGDEAAFPVLAIATAATSTLNAITVLRAYLRLFYGAPSRGPGQPLRLRERTGFALIAALLVLGGIAPGALIDWSAPLGQHALDLRAAPPDKRPLSP